MSRWKTELNGISGSLQIDTEQLADEISFKVSKRNKQRKRRIFMLLSVITLIAASFFIVWLLQPKLNTEYSKENPVYYNEFVMKAIEVGELSYNQITEEMIFEQYMYILAHEHFVREKGLFYTNKQYEEAYETIVKDELNAIKSDPSMYRTEAESLNITVENYIQTYLAPYRAHTQLIFGKLYTDGYSQLVEAQFNYMRDYQEQIKALAEFLGFEYKGIEYTHTFSGVVVTEDEKGILLAKNITLDQIETLAVEEIIESSSEALWVKLDNDMMQRNFNLGDTVFITYDENEQIDKEVITSNLFMLVEYRNRPIFAKNDLLFEEYVNSLVHIVDEEERKKAAFDNLVIDEALKNAVYYYGYTLFENEKQVIIDALKSDYEEINAHILPEINELAKQKNITYDDYLVTYILNLAAERRGMENYLNTQGFAQIKQVHAEFQIRYQQYLTKLAEKYDTTFEVTETLPTLEGYIASLEDMQILVVENASLGDIFNLSEDELIAKYPNHGWFSYYGEDANFSQGDFVRIHHSEHNYRVFPIYAEALLVEFIDAP